MKEGDPQETSEQPANAPPQASEDSSSSSAPSSTPAAPASSTASSTASSSSSGATEASKSSDPSASKPLPPVGSGGSKSGLRSSGIFKPANLSGVYNLNSLPSSSFNLNPATSSTSNNNNLSINSNGNSSSDEHVRGRRQNGVATSEANDSSTHKLSSSSNNANSNSTNNNNTSNTSNNNNTSNTSNTSNNNNTSNTSNSNSNINSNNNNSNNNNNNNPPSTTPAPAGASSPLYTTLNGGNSPPSHLKNSTSVPSIDKDLLCPICLEVMNEAFVSRCGHSFCYLCIVKHLQIKQNCPCCSVYLTRDQVFPNFIFNKIVEKTKTQPSNPLLSASTVLHIKQLQSSILGDNIISINDIETIMQTLLDKKKLLEAEDQSIEMEVLLDFLNSTKKRKMEALQVLQRELTFLDCDIERVTKLKDNLHTDPSDGRSKKKRAMDEVGKSESQDGDVAESQRFGKESLDHQKKREAIAAKRLRVEEHLEDLQTCYFESCKRHDTDDKRDDIDSITRIDRYNSHSLSRFTLNMNKFTKYSNFKVLGTLRYGDIFNQSSIVSSIEFDRDDEFFATAGVTKKIKIFDYNAIIRDTIDMHYPVAEMSCKSKISCLSWNAYIKSQIASSDYEGIVSLWDATTGQIFSQLEEHEKRVWSVDFSKCDPTQLASGSDDTKVKIWSTSTNRSVATIESKANICCVKWNPTSPYLLAFGSADHHIHYFDLRAAKEPLFVFRGHKKAVSYVKFMSKDEIVSASTDSTLKLWKNGQSECVRTFAGHTNEKNFVGLAVNGDYVCCGSENNGVYAYYKMMSKPIVGYKFGSSNPVTGEEMEDDASQFVSSVCWRKESNVLLAANSQGTIKILELV